MSRNLPDASISARGPDVIWVIQKADPGEPRVGEQGFQGVPPSLVDGSLLYSADSYKLDHDLE